MGIPKFQFWANKQNLPGYNLQNPPDGIASLCIDMPSISHQVAQYTAGYGEFSDPIEAAKFAKLSAELQLEEYKKNLIRALDIVVKQFRPTDILVIAIDGTPMLAKINQQRNRRFISEPPAVGENRFDPNKLTPGTEFMNEIDRFLREKLAERSLTDLNYPPKIIFTGHRTAHEAEHKIMELIRSGIVSLEKPLVIHAQDADLVLISMILPKTKNVYIVSARAEAQHERNLFFRFADRYYSVEAMRVGIINKMNNSLTAADDFVALMSLMGNDFLPPTPAMERFSKFDFSNERHGDPQDMPIGLDALIWVYNKLNLSLTSGGDINWANMSRFLVEVEKLENDLLADFSTRTLTHPVPRIQEAIVENESGEKFFDGTFFNTNWYHDALDWFYADFPNLISRIHPNPEIFGATIQSVLKMSANYLVGISWVYRYYKQGPDSVNFNWSYLYHYAPLLKELALVSTKITTTRESHPQSGQKPLNPLHQLLMVLPSSSADLIDTNFRHLITDPKSNLAYLYPNRSGFDVIKIGNEGAITVGGGRIINLHARTTAIIPIVGEGEKNEIVREVAYTTSKIDKHLVPNVILKFSDQGPIVITRDNKPTTSSQRSLETPSGSNIINPSSIRTGKF